MARNLKKIEADVSRGFFPEKVMKTVVRGDFTDEALDALVTILTSRDLSQEQMEWGISQLPNITQEAASILVSRWFDGGRWKMKWQEGELKKWIKVQLITKLGSKRTGEIADRIAAEVMEVKVRRIASRVVAYEFPTQDALKEYLKKHPKADKAKHWVKKDGEKPVEEKVPVEKTKEKPEPEAKGKFKIPEHKSLKYETSGDLSNIGNWKAKIVLGNSMAGNLKVGDMDEVGYVAINLKTDEIVPIARSDEHQAGYELLWHLHDKGIIKSSPENFITLYSGNNYPDYAVPEKDSGKYVDAVKKWLSYGGKSSPIVKVRGICTTDMEEYVELGGKLPDKPKEPMKPGREILGLAEALKKDLASANEGALDKAIKLVDKIQDFSHQAVYSYDDFERDKARIRKAVKAKNIEGLVGPVGSVFDQLASKMRESGFSSEQFKGLFGFGSETEKRVKALSESDDKKPEKKTEKSVGGLKPHAEESIGLFEKAAQDGAGVSQGTPNADKKLFNSARALVDHLKAGKLGIEPVDKMLGKVETAIDEEKTENVMSLLFAFNGIKNFLHQYLRELKERGQKDDSYFGEVERAFEEFNRLGQI